MTETTELKDVDRMTVGEMKAEIEERGGDKPKAGVKVSELREIVARLRADPPPETDGEPDEPEPVEGEVVAEESSPDAPETAVVPPEVRDEVETALALREHVPAPMMALPSPQEFNAAQSVAVAIADTKMVPEAYRGRPDDVLAAILYGREIGLGPMTALRDIYMIEGRPALAAHRQLGALRRGGVAILESDSTDDGAWIVAQRADTGEIMRVEFTWDDAQQVIRKGKPLVDGDNWKSYRKDMLWARCVGRLTRRLGPDLIGGLPPYVAEEVADFEGWGVEYGQTGEVRVGRRAQPQPVSYRQEYPDYNWPESWAELTKRMASRIGEEEAKEWMRQATVAVTGADSIQALPVAKRKLMFQKCSGALHAIEDATGDLMFDPNARAFVAEAFAPRLDGQILEGPPWRISPTEEDRPSLDEWKSLLDAKGDADDARAAEPDGSAEDAVDAEWTPSPEEQQEADDIPFGETHGD